MILPVLTATRQPNRTRARPKPRRRQPNLELFSLRINAGLSRRDLARRTGISVESIRIAEELGFVPGPRIQKALADAFERRPLDIWPLELQR